MFHIVINKFFIGGMLSMFSFTATSVLSREIASIQDNARQFVYKVFTPGPENEKKPLLDQVLVLNIRREKMASSVQTAQQFSQSDLIAFDARMPEHNHGMVLKPKIVKISDQEWEVHGVKFHMPGRWKLMLSVKNQNEVEVVSYDFMLTSDQ